jgi:hypothetical protein
VWVCVLPWLGAELMAAISILGNADVVVSTCVGAANDAIVDAVSLTGGGAVGGGARGKDGVMRAVRFPVVIVDEASQATEPATLVPLTQGCEQLILVGDHHQLPPTIKSRRAASKVSQLASQAHDVWCLGGCTQVCGVRQGLGVSLFTRLALAGISPSMLTLQYRMHPLIAQFPSRRSVTARHASHTWPPVGFDRCVCSPHVCVGLCCTWVVVSGSTGACSSPTLTTSARPGPRASPGPTR